MCKARGFRTKRVARDQQKQNVRLRAVKLVLFRCLSGVHLYALPGNADDGSALYHCARMIGRGVGDPRVKNAEVVTQCVLRSCSSCCSDL